jgi:hypothetical protein
MRSACVAACAAGLRIPPALSLEGFLTIDFRLEVGSVTESVAVVAAVPLIETSNASNARSLPSTDLE